MAVMFGSKEWFDQAFQELASDEDLKKAAVDWEGAIRCVINVEDPEVLKDFSTEVGVKGIVSMIGALNMEQRMQYKGTGFAKMFERLGYPIDMDLATVDVAEGVKKAQSLTLDDLKGAEIYAVFEPYHGELKKMEPIGPDEYKDARWTLSGKYSAWKTLCAGKQTSVQLVMSGKMKLAGDMAYMMKHMAAVNALTKAYTRVPII